MLSAIRGAMVAGLFEAMVEMKVEEESKEEKQEELNDEPMEGNAGQFQEKEADAPADSRPKVDIDVVRFSQSDSTLNVLPVAGCSLLRSLGEGGMQYLLASTRCCTGVKDGRYMFEVRIVEALSPVDLQGPARSPMPKQLVRVGFSTPGSSIFLGDADDTIFFDSEGFCGIGKKRTKMSLERFGKDTISIVLNLDKASPNANTVSLFIKGERVGEPQAIAESLRGKALFPVVTYRNVMLDVHFGPEPRIPLPFKCRMIADAAQADVEVNRATLPKDEKNRVVFPVGLPDRGFFAWIDGFLAKNPHYTELSSRKIIDWAARSGIWMLHLKPFAFASNDRPGMHFGLPLMDDGSVLRVIGAILPTLKRNVVLGELKGTLVPAERKTWMAAFAGLQFHKEAVVIMGEPCQEYKDMVRANFLAEKQAKAQLERKRKSQEAERQRIYEKKRRKDGEARKANMTKKVSEEDDAKDEPPPTVAAMDVDELPVNLTAEEKQLKFPKTPLPDLSEKDFAKAYASFALPEADGFDSVRYEWDDANACRELLQKYIYEQKLSRTVDDLVPGSWFKQKWSHFQKMVGEWKKRQYEWKDPSERDALIAKKVEEIKGHGEEAKEVPIVDMEELDVSSVTDISDVGSCEPLFSRFAYEDWQLLTARAEFHFLLHGFRKDLNDPDRPCFSDAHFNFYYQRYFKKAFTPASFCVADVREFLLELAKEVAKLGETGMLEALLPEDVPVTEFVKHTEEQRRDRQRLFDAGDEAAALTFPRALFQPGKGHPRPQTRVTQPQAGQKGQKGQRLVLPTPAA